MNQLFLNPGMLLWTGLVAVPVIIYLINRQRYERRRWAAMEFLLRAMKRNRRRLQLQNLLLLLLRCAVILLIVAAAARPVSRLSMLSLAPDQPHNWLLAIDTSFSMGYQEESRSLFEQARETILQMLGGVFKPGDQVALMTLDKAPRILLPPTRMGEEGEKALRREVEGLRLSSGAVDLGASFAVLDQVCSKFATPLGEPQPKRIILFSDFQRGDWLGSDGPKSPGMAQFVEKIQKEGGEIAFARLSRRDSRPNLAITALSATPALLARDVWVELRASVKNFGDEDFSNVDLTLRVDQDPEDRSTEPQVGQVVRVSRGEALTRSLAYRFSTPGYHTVVAEVKSDGLVIDNRRYLTVKVEESVKVLLVDGDPAADPTDRETFHLQVALEPEDDAMGAMQGRYTPFETRYITPEQLAGVDLQEFSVVMLAGVGEVATDQVGALLRYVKGGGALIVFLGANVRPEFYNQHFRAEEPHLLPVKIEDIHGDERFPVNLQVSDENHPLARYFEDHKEVTHLARPVISFYKYFKVAPVAADAPNLRVPFRFSDSERSPAVFDNACGSGRVLWITSTADLEWNEFANWPDYIVFLYESISYLVKFGMSSSNLTTGEVFRRTYPAAQYAPDILLTSPGGTGGEMDRVQNLRKAMKGLVEGGLGPTAGQDNEFEILHEDTAAPGIYKLELHRPNTPGGDSTEYFCANVDTAESDLRAMSSDDFKTHFENMSYQDFDATHEIQGFKKERDLTHGSEHWRWIAGCVLLLLVLETICAWRFSRRTA